MFVPHRAILSILRQNLWRNSLIAGCAALLIVVFATPSRALLAQVMPKTPILGDTIAVITPANSTVTMGGKSYPSFEMGGKFRTLLPTTPLDTPGTLSLKVTSGTDNQTLSLPLKKRSFPTQSIWLPPGQDGNVSDWEYDRVDAFKQIVSPEKYWNGKFLRPNNGPTTTGYGVRRYYNGVFAKDYYHRGVDYAGNYGSAIIAPAAGKVALLGRESEGYKVHGNVIGIDHGQGVTSIYLHLSRIDVKLGDMVKAGQKIGALGDSGAATGPHLHWGLYVHGKCVDPVPWREGDFQ
jgi:murein DD-endopeptidase MepM/ murein hydrolase activator NlpD